ncbi:MAG TPA: hypothetical protein V6D08_20775, partial [Candidatus Obscuribacterales bacterium]
SAPAGARFGRSSGQLPVTEQSSECLVRLPFWRGLTDEHIAYVANCLEEFFRESSDRAVTAGLAEQSETAEVT